MRLKYKKVFCVHYFYFTERSDCSNHYSYKKNYQLLHIFLFMLLLFLKKCYYLNYNIIPVISKLVDNQKT